jgi:hypothetical protein
MVHLSSFRKVKAFGRTNFISSTGCPSEHPEQRGGALNCIATTPLPSCVVGRNGILTGYCNEIIGQTLFSSITGGGENRINNSCLGFIGGGDYNFIQPNTGGPGIVAGSLISGGHSNCVHDNLAAIGGGSANLIDVGGERSVISGGNNNTIIAQGAVIGGGTNNTVSGSCSVIAGGQGNVSTGAFSAILGGNGNNDSGLPNTFIAGSGLIAAALPGGNGGLFANEIVIQNIPVVTAVTYPTLQVGQVYTTVAPGSGFMSSPLYVA